MAVQCGTSASRTEWWREDADCLLSELVRTERAQRRLAARQGEILAELERR
ncbi:hypothetical protein [Amycolatopsis samaneae]|uniref:hypothetical protein n=1 Tax=Amycolatopsis samaneae TaxID=664691 RepID=UPI0031E945C0